MNFIVWLIVGAVVGWLVSLIMKIDDLQGTLMNAVIGVVGAFIGGWLVAPLVGMGPINDGLTFGSFVMSLIGAIILVAVVSLFSPGRRH